MAIWNPKQTLDDIGLGEKGARSGKRSDRVARAIQQEVSLLLVEKISDPRLSGVSVSRVEVTSDLAEAKIYYTVLGGSKAVAEAGRGWKRASGFVRSHIAHTLNLRFTPVLNFFYDNTVEKVAELEEIFQEIDRERKEKP
ncbi:MAG: 30S ribosome-binding factor RbfA [Desulforhopalus sp.]|nr:30S ribosome-binding factor RbfA [Desulforhopalus sp.]